MKWLISLSLIAVVHGALEAVADAPEPWLQVCCQDNDKNDDGGISFREFTPFVLEILDVTRKEMEQIFLKGDVDRNSDLDGTECPIIRAQLREKMREKVTNALKNYDSNGDKRLSKEEVVKLAKEQFKVTANEADHIYFLVNNNQPISGSQLTDLLLELRNSQIRLSGGKTASWDANGNGVISYEELRGGLGKRIPPLTLKQAFKRVDYDKDLHLSKAEYVALENELERANISLTDNRRKRSDDGITSMEDEFLTKNARLLPKYDLHFERSFSRDSAAFSSGFIGGDEHRVRPRSSDSQTAPPITIDLNMEIDEKFAKMLSSRRRFNMSGGGSGPSVQDAVTVDPNDPDFQRF